MITQRIPGLSVCAILILAALTPSHAQFWGQRSYFTTAPSAANKSPIWTSAQYVDFSSTSTNTGRTWATFNFNGTPTEKYLEFRIVSPNDGKFHCFEITTDNGYNGGQDAQTNNGDTRLFMRQKGSTTIFYAIHDDIGQVTQNGPIIRHAKMRVWSLPNLVTHYRAAAYSTAHNGIDFYLITKEVKAASKADCKLANLPLVNTDTPDTEYKTEL